MKLLLTIAAVAIVGISGLLLFNDVAEAAPHCKVDKTPTWRVAHTRLDGNQANHNLMNYHGQPLSASGSVFSVAGMWVKDDANGDGTRTLRYVSSSSVRLTNGDTAKACIRHYAYLSWLNNGTWVNWYVMAYPVTYRN